MGHMDPHFAAARPEVVNLSRRNLLGAAAAGALVLGLGAPKHAPAAVGASPDRYPPGSAKGRDVAAFLTINPDETVTLRNPFGEMGQGVYTSVPQIIAEELDADIAAFRVEQAPHGPAWQIMFGDRLRLTGGSLTTRTTFTTFRVVGATARSMLMAAAARRWDVPVADLTTEPGKVLHAASGRAASYGSLAADAAALEPPADVKLRDPATFRLIGQPVPRTDVYVKSTGRAVFGIDTRVPDMRYAAVVHSPRYAEADSIDDTKARAMPGVVSVRKLPGGVAVVADSFWRAKQAAAALRITWSGGTIPADFSSSGHLAALQAGFAQKGETAEARGHADAPLAGAARVIEASYDAPYLSHATMEPQNATARFNPDGTLEVWLGNQAPDFFAQVAAGAGGVPVDKVIVHTPFLGGGFGRRFTYGMEVLAEAVLLAKAEGAPVKVVWHREEDFARDHFRPLSAVHFRARLDTDNRLTGLEIVAAGEGPTGRHFSSFMRDPKVDDSVVEGLTERAYAIQDLRVGYVKVVHPTNIGFWRSVGHSMNAFFYESFLDEVAKAAEKDPVAFRLDLLRDSPRQATLLRAVVDLAGGFRSAPYTVAGARRAMGVAMDNPFGSEVAVIAEVSADKGEVRVHRVWIAIDPGSVVNPAIVTNQMHSGVAMGVSQALLEQITFKDGWIEQSNFDTYSFLPPDKMPEVFVRIVESGAPMGGIGEPGTPAVAPAIANAVATLSGQRIRSLPLSKAKIGEV